MLCVLCLILVGVAKQVLTLFLVVINGKKKCNDYVFALTESLTTSAVIYTIACRFSAFFSVKKNMMKTLAY